MEPITTEGKENKDMQSISITTAQAQTLERSGRRDRPLPTPTTEEVPVDPVDLVVGAREGLGRSLSLDEVRRIVNAGPLTGRPLSDPDVMEWLALLELKYVRPPARQSAWSVFVEQHIDSALEAHSWQTLPESALHDICDIFDDMAGESLSRLGWAWTVADSDDIDSYDVGEVLADPYGCGFNPVVADGIPGFVFRAGSREDAIVRHTAIDPRNRDALEMIAGVSLVDIVTQAHFADFALKIFANPA